MVITASAPPHALGATNGLAQTAALVACGRRSGSKFVVWCVIRVRYSYILMMEGMGNGGGRMLWDAVEGELGNRFGGW